AGLSEAEANECMTSQALFDRLRDAANAAQKDYGVESTPTFIIGEEKIVGAQDYAVFAKALDAALSGQASAPQSNSESDAQSQAAAQPLSSAVAD
ncbi:MAG: DsbA family protein, partial [Rhodospirillales bacterium]